MRSLSCQPITMHFRRCRHYAGMPVLATAARIVHGPNKQPSCPTTREEHRRIQYRHQRTISPLRHSVGMPGRTSTRSVRTSTASAAGKSSTGTVKSTRASSARQSSNAVEIPDEGPLTSLRTQIAQVFGDAQKTTATQRNSSGNLRMIQEGMLL